MHVCPSEPREKRKRTIAIVLVLTYPSAMAKERFAGGTASMFARLMPAVQTKRSSCVGKW